MVSETDQGMKAVIREGIGEARRDQRRHGELTAQVRNSNSSNNSRAPVHNEITGHQAGRVEMARVVLRVQRRQVC